jgi:hypothetical protein
MIQSVVSLRSVIKGSVFITLSIVYIIGSAFLSTQVIDNNPTADLQVYVLGFEEYGRSYFEPLSALYFEAIRIIANIAGFEWLLSAVTASIFSIFIGLKCKSDFAMKLFCLISLGPVISLINIRFGAFFLVILASTNTIAKSVGFLTHWTLLVLYLPHSLLKIKNKLIFIISSIAVLFSIYSLNLYSVLFDKIQHYISIEEPVYGTAIFFEIIIAVFVWHYVYKQSKRGTFAIMTILALSFLMAAGGFPIIAGRLFSLSLILSIFDLHMNICLPPRKLVHMGLAVIAVYELYRAALMLGIDANYN